MDRDSQENLDEKKDKENIIMQLNEIATFFTMTDINSDKYRGMLDLLILQIPKYVGSLEKKDQEKEYYQIAELINDKILPAFANIEGYLMNLKDGLNDLQIFWESSQ